MALIDCPECTTQVSDEDVLCSYCSFPIKRINERRIIRQQVKIDFIEYKLRFAELKKQSTYNQLTFEQKSEMMVDLATKQFKDKSREYIDLWHLMGNEDVSLVIGESKLAEANLASLKHTSVNIENDPAIIRSTDIENNTPANEPTPKLPTQIVVCWECKREYSYGQRSCPYCGKWNLLKNTGVESLETLLCGGCNREYPYVLESCPDCGKVNHLNYQKRAEEKITKTSGTKIQKIVLLASCAAIIMCMLIYIQDRNKIEQQKEIEKVSRLEAERKKEIDNEARLETKNKVTKSENKPNEPADGQKEYYWNESDSIEARTFAKLFVEQALKAPKTATLQDAIDFRAAPLKNKKGIPIKDAWEVSGYVDAQNSFGAMMRTNWNVKIKNNGSNWQLIRPVQFWQ